MRRPRSPARARAAPSSRARRRPRPAASGDDPRFQRVLDAFASERGVSQGRMMASLGLRVKGRIFAMSVRGALVVKLPRERVDALVGSGVGERFDPRRDGRVMKEWLSVAGDAPDWVELSREAYRFVRGGA